MKSCAAATLILCMASSTPSTSVTGASANASADATGSWTGFGGQKSHAHGDRRLPTGLLLREDFESPDHGDSKWQDDIDGRTGYIRAGPRDFEGRKGGSVDFGVSYCGDGTCYRSEYKRPPSRRSEDLQLGRVYWFGFTMMLPANDTYTDTMHPNIFHFQLHGGDNIGRAPSFGLSLHDATQPMHWRIYTAGDDRPSSTASDTPKWSQSFDVGAVTFGVWEDFVVKIQLECTPIGMLTVWRNGRQAVNQSSVATAYNDTHPPYIKLGAYINKPFKETSGVHTSWWGARYWQLKVGRADSSFESVSTAHTTKQP